MDAPQSKTGRRIFPPTCFTEHDQEPFPGEPRPLMTTIARPNYSTISREEAVERIHQLETAAGLHFETHPRYGLTTAEQMLLGLLYSTPATLTREHAYTFMYGMNEDPPEQKIFDIWICKLRAKLRPLGVTIETVWGRGWFMDEDNKARVKAMQIAPMVEAAA